MKHLSPQNAFNAIEATCDYSIQDAAGKRHNVSIAMDTLCGNNDIDSLIDGIRDEFSDPDSADMLPGDVANEILVNVHVEVDDVEVDTDLWTDWRRNFSADGGWVCGGDGCGLTEAREEVNRIVGEDDLDYTDELGEFDDAVTQVADRVWSMAIEPIQRRMERRGFPMKEE